MLGGSSDGKQFILLSLVKVQAVYMRFNRSSFVHELN